MSYLNFEQVNNMTWFLQSLGLVRKVSLMLLEDGKFSVKSEKDLVEALVMSDKYVEDNMDKSYGDSRHIGLVGSERRNIKMLKKICKDWDIDVVDDGPALSSVLNDFYDRYGEPYSHLNIDKKNNRIYDMEQYYGSLGYMLLDHNITIYYDEDGDIDDMGECDAYCDDRFYRIKIRDKELYNYYSNRKDESSKNTLVYFIQRVIYTVASYGIIIGMNLYNDIDYIDVLISVCSYLDTDKPYYLEDAKNMANIYILKNYIKSQLEGV